MNNDSRSKLQIFVEKVKDMRERQTKAAAASSSGQHGKARELFAEAKTFAGQVDGLLPEINSILKGAEQTALL